MPPAPSPRVRALHVAVLAAFAVSQPLFDLLGRHVEFLLAHGLDRADLVGLALFLGLGVPGALAAATGALGRVAGRAAPALHAGAVALLVAAIALPVLARSVGSGAPAALVAAVGAGLGVAAAVAYARAAPLRRLLTVASPALLAFPLLFLLASPASSLLFPERRSDEVAGVARKDVGVVMVVFDGLPLTSLLDESGAIDSLRFPHLAALAETAHLFRNATTVTETTEYAVPAIATGLYPQWDLPPTTDAYPQNLFTLLAESHELNVFEPLTRLCPPDLCVAGPARVPRAERWAGVLSDLGFVYAHAVLPAEWRRGLPGVQSTWRDFARPDPDDPADWHRRLRSRRGDMRWVFAEFLARVAKRDRPALHFLHANVPHGPYKYLPSGVEYRPVPIHPNTRARGGGAGDPAWAETQALQRHLLQVGYADALWGALRRRLEEEGLWDDSLVVVTADHGVSFTPGLPSRQLGDEGENAADLLLVPLFVKLPGQREGRVSDRNVETVDILPTVIDVLGGALPQAVDGRSLLDASAPERGRKLVFRDQRRGPRVRRERGVLVPDIPDRDATVSRIAERFGRGTGVAGLYAVGPHRELLGRDVAALPLGAASALRVRLDGRADYDAVDTASGFLPALVAGSLRGSEVPADPLDLAVAVNGTVRASTRTFGHTGDGARFAAMVPEDAFRDGRNDVEVFVVAERSEGLVLSPTRVRPTTRYAAVTAPDGTLAAVLSSEGRLYPVVEDAVQGHVRREGDTFAGVLVDARRRRTGEAVLLFEDGRFRAAHPVEPEPVERLSEPVEGVVRVLVAPFEFPVPGLAADDGDEGRLRFLGLSAAAASELSYRTNFRLRGAWSGPAVALSLEEREGREGIAASSGEWIALGGRGVRGRFRASEAAGGGIAISGWAADAAGTDPPRAALLFAAGRFAGTVGIDRPCPEAAPETAPCAFEARLPADPHGGATPDTIRVLVTTPSGAAAELEPDRG